MYWRQVLKRVVAVIRFFSERGLTFRGDNGIFRSVYNGYYLGVLQLLAQFAPFLAEHIQTRCNPGRGNTNYLSSTICDEFMMMLGDRILTTICCEIKSTKYFSIMLDSTSDHSHTDQLTFIVRYVNQGGEVLERFLKCVPIISHTGENLEQCVLDTLSELDLNLGNCRGQSYNSAANMSSRCKELQARILQLNSLADCSMRDSFVKLGWPGEC